MFHVFGFHSFFLLFLSWINSTVGFGVPCLYLISQKTFSIKAILFLMAMSLPQRKTDLSIKSFNFVHCFIWHSFGAYFVCILCYAATEFYLIFFFLRTMRTDKKDATLFFFLHFRITYTSIGISKVIHAWRRIQVHYVCLCCWYTVNT